MRKPKFMILGAGKYQVPLIEKASQLGYETLAVSIPGPYPGFDVADRCFELDVRDRKGILELARRENICGIATDGTDLPVPTAAYVAENLGLPGIGSACAHRFTDKKIMKATASALGIPSPESRQASNVTEAIRSAEEVGYPVVVKPTHSQGARGVWKVNEPSELSVRFKEAKGFSPEGTVEIEAWIMGKEIWVLGVVSNHYFQNLVIGDRTFFGAKDRFIIRDGVSPPDLDPKVANKVLQVNDRLIRGFNPSFGNTYSEFLIHRASGEIYLIEAAIRGGGAYLSSEIVELVRGVDPLTPLIRQAAGEVDFVDIRPDSQSRAAGYLCFGLPAGVIRKVDSVECLLALPGVKKAYLDDIRPGMETQKMSDKAGRKGPIVFSAKDRSSCVALMGRIRETLVIEVETAQGIRPIEW